MKKLIISFLLLIYHFGLAQKKESLYKDTEEASVQVKNIENGITYSTRETTYQLQFLSSPK